MPLPLGAARHAPQELGANPILGLCAAAQGGSVAVTDVLLRALGSSGFGAAHWAGAALTIAARHGHVDLLRFLLSR